MTQRRLAARALVLVVSASCSEPPRSLPCTVTDWSSPPLQVRRTSYWYDSAGRQVGSAFDEDADGKPEQVDVFVLDDRGLATARIRLGPGTSERTSYDDAARPTRRVLVENGRVLVTTDFVYDDARLVRATDRLETTTYHYDDRGNLRSERSTANDGRLRAEIEHDYDTAGRRTESRITMPVPGSENPSRQRVRYILDDDGNVNEEISEVDGELTNRSTYLYDRSGHRIAARAWDASGALVQIDATVFGPDGEPISEMRYNLAQGSTSQRIYGNSCRGHAVR
jgi:YD repeat-containing protein